MNEQTGATDPESTIDLGGQKHSVVMRRMMIHLYNTAYHSGHHDTVEGMYTDVLPVDMDSYHEDIVDEWLSENYPDA